MDYKANLITLSNTLADVKISINSLTVLLGGEPGDKESGQYLDTLSARLEKAVILARNLYEYTKRGLEIAKVKAPTLPNMNIAGEIDIIENGWLHIRLNTLLPHCRFQTPAYLSDTLTRLLDELAARKGKLPFFKNAMLVIDEHCDIQSRNVYDQDNKGYKAVPNALKGRVFPEDDQFTLGLALLSTLDSVPSCNIFVLNAGEAGDFFSIRANGYSGWGLR